MGGLAERDPGVMAGFGSLAPGVVVVRDGAWGGAVWRLASLLSEMNCVLMQQRRVLLWPFVACMIGNLVVTDAQVPLVTTLVGNGTSGFLDGVGSSATFNGPGGSAVDLSASFVLVVSRVGGVGIGEMSVYHAPPP